MTSIRGSALASIFVLLLCAPACGAGVGPPTTDTTGDESTSSGAATTTTGDTPPTTTDDPTSGTATTTGETTASTDPPETESGTTPPACGDGELGGDEACDGGELGGKTCADIDESFIGGELGCTADCVFDTSACEVDPALPLVVLNEVLSKSAVAGPFADMGDAIEIFNAGGAEADLSGWKLSDDPLFSLEKTYVFPVGTTLAPGEWLVLVELDAMLGEGDFPFGISSEAEETLALVDGLDAPVDQVVVPGADAVVSYCRLPDGLGAWQKCDQTLGAANAGPSSDCGDGVVEGGEECDGAELGGETCEGLGLGFTGGTLACTPACTFDASMCTSDNTVAINELESTNDAIEIHNAGNQPVDLSGWILTDDPVAADYDPANDLEKLVFPANTSLGAKQFLVVAKGNGPTQHIFGLSANGDTVTLLQASLDVVDQVSYGINEATVSYCRLPDGPGGTWTTGCMPTFGMANDGP
jgi:hypothetical protein